MTTVATFNGLSQAVGAKAALDAAGVRSELLDAYTAGVNWFCILALGGIRLEVAPEAAARARAFLAHGEDEAPVDKDESAYLSAQRRRRRFLAIVAFALMTPWVRIFAHLFKAYGLL